MKLPVPVLILALVAAVTSAALSARPGFPGSPGHPDGMFFLDMMADKIGLTEAQEAEIDELANAFRLETAVDRERMEQIRSELRDLAQSDAGYDSNAAERLTDELSEIVARTALGGSELHYQIRQVLTPEQRAQIKELHAGMRGRRFNFDSQYPLTDNP